ncbi:hypothetical protein LP419_08900 [Massilia sp. H-1]|nr:hypothetical protein LP419_08900 [Massilia sp. H-1]
MVRSNSWAPMSASSAWMAWLSGGWPMWRRSAAAREMQFLGDGDEVAQVA